MDFINNCGNYMYMSLFKKRIWNKENISKEMVEKRRYHGKNDKRVLNKIFKKKSSSILWKRGIFSWKFSVFIMSLGPSESFQQHEKACERLYLS